MNGCSYPQNYVPHRFWYINISVSCQATQLKAGNSQDNPPHSAAEVSLNAPGSCMRTLGLMDTLGEAQAVEKSPWMLGNMNQLRKKPSHDGWNWRLSEQLKTRKLWESTNNAWADQTEISNLDEGLGRRLQRRSMGVRKQITTIDLRKAITNHQLFC